MAGSQEPVRRRGSRFPPRVRVERTTGSAAPDHVGCAGVLFHVKMHWGGSPSPFGHTLSAAGQRRFCLAELRDVTDKTFGAEVLESAVPVLVDFWGDHCPACRQISPILRDLADAYDGRVRIVKVHAAENPCTSARYAIRAMPTVLVFSRGEVVGQLVGARPKAAFVEAIGRVL